MPKETSGNHPLRSSSPSNNPRLSPDEYYFNEKGFLVFTEQYHLRRGYCCKSQCRHCPYGVKKG